LERVFVSSRANKGRPGKYVTFLLKREKSRKGKEEKVKNGPAEERKNHLNPKELPAKKRRENSFIVVVDWTVGGGPTGSPTGTACVHLWRPQPGGGGKNQPAL